jgi:hypothetical protein
MSVHLNSSNLSVCGALEHKHTSGTLTQSISEENMQLSPRASSVQIVERRVLTYPGIQFGLEEKQASQLAQAVHSSIEDDEMPPLVEDKRTAAALARQSNELPPEAEGLPKFFLNFILDELDWGKEINPLEQEKLFKLYGVDTIRDYLYVSWEMRDRDVDPSELPANPMQELYDQYRCKEIGDLRKQLKENHINRIVNQVFSLCGVDNREDFQLAIHQYKAEGLFQIPRFLENLCESDDSLWNYFKRDYQTDDEGLRRKLIDLQDRRKKGKVSENSEPNKAQEPLEFPNVQEKGWFPKEAFPSGIREFLEQTPLKQLIEGFNKTAEFVPPKGWKYILQEHPVCFVKLILSREISSDDVRYFVKFIEDSKKNRSINRTPLYQIVVGFLSAVELKTCLEALKNAEYSPSIALQFSEVLGSGIHLDEEMFSALYSNFLDQLGV